MNIETPYGNICTAHGIDLSRSPVFQGEDLCLFGSPQPQRHPFRVGNTTLRVADGSPVNCDTIELTAHCHGTHTESAGHITREALPVGPLLPTALLSVYVHTVVPGTAAGCPEQLPANAQDSDRIITEAEINRLPQESFECLLIRTKGFLPEGSCPDAPYFSQNAMAAIVQRDFQHLLVDLPSVDRSDDGGVLMNHRTFWGLPMGSTELPAEAFRQKTITELVAVPESVSDGLYVLSLQAPNWHTDAVPSRPILYSIGEPS